MTSNSAIHKKITLYGVVLSPYYRIALHAAEVFGDAITVVPVMPGKNISTLEGKNPFMQIPTAEVDGLTLWESTAIARYIAAKTPLYPTDDPRAAAPVDMAIGAALSQVLPKAVPIFYSCLVGPKMRGEEMPSDEAIEKMRKDLAVPLDKLEKSALITSAAGAPAQQHPFLWHNRNQTLGDITLFAVLTTIVEVGLFNLGPWPGINRWYETYRALGTTRRAYAPFFEALRGMGVDVADKDLASVPAYDKLTEKDGRVDRKL